MFLMKLAGSQRFVGMGLCFSGVTSKALEKSKKDIRRDLKDLPLFLGFLMIFVSHCRRKYGLALIAQLIQKYGGDLGIGYDIACSMSKTAGEHPLLQNKIDKVKWACGAFHAFAHNRACQLQYNPRYVYCGLYICKCISSELVIKLQIHRRLRSR